MGLRVRQVHRCGRPVAPPPPPCPPPWCPAPPSPLHPTPRRPPAWGRFAAGGDVASSTPFTTGLRPRLLRRRCRLVACRLLLSPGGLRLSREEKKRVRERKEGKREGDDVATLTCGTHVGPTLTQPPHRTKPGTLKVVNSYTPPEEKTHTGTT
uniref:Uncharacterized protein n=1 Tax=Oryza glumipatula TaxID=40148 RepID=A0A0D9Y9A6_9ORYZ